MCVRLLYLMNSVEEKRANFREEIRRRYINNMFKEIREQLSLQHSTTFQPVDHSLCQQFASVLKDVLANVIALSKQGQYRQIGEQVQVLACGVEEHPETMSFCVDQELLARGHYFIDAVKQDVPLAVLGGLSDEEDNMEEV